jgi:hypothetical protein
LLRSRCSLAMTGVEDCTEIPNFYANCAELVKHAG